jgi:hypothetical protein
MLNVIMLSVANVPFILSVIMLDVIMLSVVSLSVISTVFCLCWLSQISPYAEYGKTPLY